MQDTRECEVGYMVVGGSDSISEREREKQRERRGGETRKRTRLEELNIEGGKRDNVDERRDILPNCATQFTKRESVNDKTGEGKRPGVTFCRIVRANRPGIQRTARCRVAFAPVDLRRPCVGKAYAAQPSSNTNHDSGYHTCRRAVEVERRLGG